MIKPNQLYIILGVPRHKQGYGCNGKIVKTTSIRRQDPQGEIWGFEPTLVDQHTQRTYSACASRWLHPLQDFQDELAQEALDLAIKQAFQETRIKELTK